VINKVEITIKPIARPIVQGIKAIPFVDTKTELAKLNNKIDEKIDSIDLSEIQK